MEDIKQALRESHEEEMSYHNQAIISLDKRYLELQKRVDAAYIDKLDGQITQSKYDELTMLWRNEQSENRQRKEQHEKSNINYLELGSKLLEVSNNAKNIYTKRSDDEKRQLMNLVFSNLTLKNKILSKTYSKPFAIVAERVKSNNLSGCRELNPGYMTPSHV